MHLTLPESLMLFALHDARGTILHPAFVAIDHGLRGAVLAELKLRGHLQTRTNGDARVHPSAPPPPATPLLRDALAALTSLTTDGPVDVSVWMDRLSRVMPDTRQRVLGLLQGRGLLAVQERERVGLEGARHFVARDDDVEQSLRVTVTAALDAGDAVRQREGVLIALTVACHLEHEVFGPRAEEAVARAEWVAERDAVVRAARAAVAAAEGVEA